MFAINPLYSVAGVFVGLLVGMTGVGGGSLMTPLLVLLFGFHPATAVGTDLLYASATKTVGAGVHGLHGTIDWRVVRRLATGSVPAAALALLWLSYSNQKPEGSAAAISLVLGCTLIATAVATFFRARLVAVMAPRFERLGERGIGGVTVALGAVLGVLVSLTSVGAGALGMTALLILYPHQPVNRLVGSDIAHAVPLTLLAGTGHWLLGSVDGALLLSLLAGSVPGIIIGSLLATRTTDRVLVPILAATLGLVGIKMLF
ncbi:sulfite exporter TauE/SafE family protein [Sphingomonas sp. RS6]